MNLTPSQLSAVEHRGSNLLVAASAGSGKTEILARRCAAIIADPLAPCGVDRLLVVTFTRAAAAELRVRIAAMLRRAADQATDPRLRAHVQRQERLIDTADIGTIDSWCARLLREHFATAGVDPGFTVLAAEEATLLRTRLLDELFNEIATIAHPAPPADADSIPAAHAAAANDRAVRGATEPIPGDLARSVVEWVQRSARPDDAWLRDAVRRLHDFREHLVDPAAWFATQAAAARGTHEQCRAAAETLLSGSLAGELAFQSEQIAALPLEGIGSVATSQITAYAEALRTWSALLTDSTPLRAVVDQIHAHQFDRWKGDDPAGRRLRDRIKAVWWDRRLRRAWPPESVQRVLDGAGRAAELLRVVLALEHHYDQRLRAEKTRRGSYEFADVLRLALDLLGHAGSSPREPTRVARALRDRYEHVLVDEYQDTSPVQVELLRLVARHEPGRSNRFLVGDVKQSIYGFRQAEPALFVELASALETGRCDGRVQPLTDNFRSHAGVLDPLNDVFAALFDPALGGTAYGPRERLVARRAECPNPTLDGSPRIELHVIEDDRSTDREPDEAATDAADGGEEEPAAPPGDQMPIERIEREARIAAACIRELIDRPALVPEAGQTPRLRRLVWSDVVILLRAAATNAGLLAAALRRQGIPAVALGRESLLDCREVHDVRHALALLVNRRQDVPLAAFLRGPLGGLTDQDLCDVRLAFPTGRFAPAVWRCLPQQDESPAADPLAVALSSLDDRRALRRRLAAAAARLDAWAALAREADLAEVVRQIVRDGALKLFARALPGGEHRVAMLDALEAAAAEFARSGGSIAEFVDHLDALEESDMRPPAASAGGGNAVRVMTIHASKGLEFPVVLLLNSGAEFRLRKRDDGLVCDESLGIGLRAVDYPARTEVESAALAEITRRSRQRELEEELRLLYVAATRAREKLIIVGHDSAGNPADAPPPPAPTAPPSLMDRLNAPHVLAWLTMSIQSAALAEGPAPRVRVCRHSASELDRSLRPPRGGRAADPPPDPTAPDAPPDQPAADDRAWQARALELITARPDLSLARTPAVLSVSRLKQSARAPGDREPTPAPAAPVTLGRPRFAQADEPADGRTAGTAAHRFLALADLRRIADETDIRRQLDALLADGRMTRDDAALVPVADIAWFAATAVGRRASAARVRREMPFLVALPSVERDDATLLRGVIDCLIEGAEPEILDYKTDQPRGVRDWRERGDGYSIQLGLYAAAVSTLLARPVSSAWLVFLRARRIESVDVSEPRQAQRMAWLRAGAWAAPFRDPDRQPR